MKWKTGILLTAALAAAAALLIFPAQASEGAGKGVAYCLNVLIPSLYPFMVLSVFVVKSGLSRKIAGPLERFTQKVFKLPGSAAASVLMSMIGGYPAGARSIAALYAEGSISGEQAGRMLSFCVAAGPSFVITAVGAGFLKNPSAGVLLFAAQVLVFLLLGFLSGLTAKQKTSSRPKKSIPDSDPSRALIASAADAAAATLNMCCFVILFAALMNLLRMSVTDPDISALLSAALEVTGGCSDLANRGAGLTAVAFAIGWGGVCVHFQVLSSVTDIPFSRPRFFFFRLLQGILTAAITWGFLMLWPESVETFCTLAGPIRGELSGSVPASAVLLLLCVLLLFSIPRERLENRGTE